MFSRDFRPRAIIVCVILLAGTSAQAGPIAISEVTQFSRYRSAAELQLSSGLQTVGTLRSGLNGPTQETSSVKQPITGVSLEGLPPFAVGVATTDEPSDSLLAGVTVSSEGQEAGVVIADQGDLEGTICDCGEFTVASGGLPKWPLAFLAAIPFFFIHGCDRCDTPTPTFTPPTTPLTLPSPPATPTVPQVPEPASLMLLGSGLAFFGAFFRRRHARSKLAAQIVEEG